MDARASKRELSLQEVTNFRSIISLKLQAKFGVDYRKAMDYLQFIGYAGNWTYGERCRREVPLDDLAMQVEEYYYN